MPTSKERTPRYDYVLDDTLTLEVEGVVHQLPTRTGPELPPGTAHQAFNHSGVAVEFLVVSEPPSHGDRRDATECFADALAAL